MAVTGAQADQVAELIEAFARQADPSSRCFRDDCVRLANDVIDWLGLEFADEGNKAEDKTGNSLRRQTISGLSRAGVGRFARVCQSLRGQR